MAGLDQRDVSPCSSNLRPKFSTSLLKQLPFSEDVAHDLAAHRLRQGIHELNDSRVLVGRSPALDKLLELTDERLPVSLLQPHSFGILAPNSIDKCELELLLDNHIICLN